jgi:hypothetical protein
MHRPLAGDDELDLKPRDRRPFHIAGGPTDPASELSWSGVERNCICRQ